MSHKSFYQNMGWQYALQALKYLFPFILVGYLTRALGPDTYAVYAYVLSFMGIMQTIADFGFTLSGTKKIAERKNDVREMSHLVGAITSARIILIILLFIATCIIAQFIPILSDNMVYVVIAYFSVCLRALLPDFVFQGLEKMGPLTTRYFVARGASVLLTLIFVHSAADLLFVAFADLIGCAVGLVWSFIASKKLFGVGLAWATARESLIELKDSAIYCISNVSSSLFSGFTTIIIGLALTNNADISYWSLALTTISAVQALYSPVSNSLYPHMINSPDYKFAKKLALIALPILAVGTLLYCVLSEPIMLILGGSDYLDGAEVMVMLSPVLPLSFYAVFVGWPILGACGYVKKLTLTTVLTGVVNVALMLLLYLTGAATLVSLCIARCAVEAFLLSSRALALVSVFRGGPKPGSRQSSGEKTREVAERL